jgi:large subunit ribosomal protein L7Ae
MNVPFVIVKGKARLGYLVHKKQAAVLALTEVEKEDESALAQMADLANTVFSQAERKTGGLKLSTKSQQLFTKRENAAKNTIKA